MSSSFVFALSLLSALSPVVDAHFRMPTGTMISSRMDPLIAPGAVSAHVHDIAGGNNFKANYDYDDLRRSTCSTVVVQDDLSNYWAPAVYYKHRDGTLQLLKSRYLIYYLLRSNGRERIQQWPAGFRMIAGQAFKNAPADDVQDKAINYKCLDADPTIPETPDWPKRHCPNGVRVQVMFPSCWNNVDVTSANFKTHVSYPVGVKEGGECPSSHPIRLPTLFYEHIIETGSFEYYEGAFVLANGDDVGWSSHGDFQNGWDASPNSVLQQAIDTCHDNNANLDACPVLMRSYNEAAANACRPNTNLPLEDVGFYGGLRELPGDNPIWGGGKPRNVRGSSNTPPFSSAYSTLAPGWSEHGCIDEGNAYVNAMNGDKFTDAYMYPGMCVDYCESKGFRLAGLQAGNECFCANDLTNGGSMNRIDKGICNAVCPGSAYEFCGAQRKISLYVKSDTSRTGTSSNSNPPVGGRFNRVYTNDGSSSPTPPGGSSPPSSGNGNNSGGNTSNGNNSPAPNPSNPVQPPVCSTGRRVKRSKKTKRVIAVEEIEARDDERFHVPIRHRRYSGSRH